GAAPLAGDRVPDPGLPDVFHPGHQVADFAHTQAVTRLLVGGDDADLEQFVGGVGRHHPDAVARDDPPVHHPDVGDHAAVGVVHRVEDHRPGRCRAVAYRGGDLLDHHVEQLTHTLPGLRADPQHIIGLAAEDMRQLGSVAIRVGGGQIDLVEDRDDPEIFFQSQVQVGQRLRLDALRGVHQQHRTLACFQCAGYLVGEIDVPGGVDQVQDMIDAADAPG